MRIATMLASLVFMSTAALAHQPLTQEYTLKNGLKLLVREDHRAPVATVQIWYKVGSSYEHDGITGISHILEHMLFKGTPTHPEGQLTDIIYKMGGSLNASTYDDYTGYFEWLPAAQVPVALSLEADRMRNTVFSENNFKPELQVVIEERRLKVDDVPESLAYERFSASAYVNSPYHHPTIGWPADLQASTLDDAKHWYETWYAPNNATVVVVGDVNPSQVYSWVQEYFEPIKPSVLPVIKPQTEVQRLGEKQVIVKLPAKLPILYMGLNMPVLNTASMHDVAALIVMASILDGGESARLSNHLIRGKQLASFVGVSYNPLARMDNLLVFSAYPKPGVDMNTLQAAFWDEILALQTEAVTQAELTSAKIQYKAQYIYAQDSIDSQANELGILESVGLSWKTKDALLAAIEQTTAQDIQQVAQHYFHRDGLTTGILEPMALEARTPS